MLHLIARLSIRGRFSLLAGTLLALLLLSSVIALYSMHQIGRELHGIAEQDIPLTAALSKITTHQLEQAIHFERAVRYGEIIDKEPHSAALMEREQRKFEQLSHQVDEEIEAALAMIGDMIRVATSDQPGKDFRVIEQSLRRIGSQHRSYSDHARAVFRLL